MSNYNYTLMILVRDNETNEIIREVQEFDLNDHTLNCISDDIAELLEEDEEDDEDES